MPNLYLTPAAIGYLTEFILAGVFTLYLASRVRRSTRPLQTALLTSFFAATGLFIFLLLLDAALPPGQRLYPVYLVTAAAGLCLIFLLQFAYHFPQLDPRAKWLARLTLVYAVLYTLTETLFALYRFVELAAGHVHYRDPWLDTALAAGFLWAPLVFIRQTLYADDRSVSWLRKLWRPHGQAARTARAFALVYVLTLALSLVNLLRGFNILPTAFYQMSMSVGLLLALFGFAMVYVNSLPETTSFMVKLAGVSLTALLTLLGAVGWVMAPVYAAQYRPPLADRQTLRFTPNAAGGYDVTRAVLHFDDAPGHALDMPAEVKVHSMPLDFSFPFLGQTYETVYVTNIGAVSMGKPLNPRDVQYRYGTTPAIFALTTFLESEKGAGIFAKNDGERLTITWLRQPDFFQREALYTFQMVLQRDGVFEITYAGLPEKLTYRPDADPLESVWFVGVVPGNQIDAPPQVSFGNLPLSGASAGFVQDYYLDFRSYLHQLLEPLAWLILASVLLGAGVPFLLYTSLVRPLNTLLGGVRQVNAGNLTVQMPIHARDEIGFLTESFNSMIAQLRADVADLEARVEQRTADLQSANAQLRNEITVRQQAQAQIIEQQRTLAAHEERERVGRELHDGLGQVMGYVNVQAQAVRALLDAGQSAQATIALRQLERVAQDAHTDVRHYILGIRAAGAEKPTDFISALREYVKTFARTYGIRVAVETRQADMSCLGTVRFDHNVFTDEAEAELLRIIQEALTNVRKHARVDRAELALTVEQDRVQVIIADRGCGFELPDVTGRQRPVTSDSSGDGHFGLEIMHERAKAVGGQLEVRSTPGQGTQVIVTMPLAPPLTPSPDSGGGLERGWRVLLVDDHPLFLDGLRDMLTARGLCVVGMGRDGLEAQELARALQPDLILMDIQMPRCDGLEAARRIKHELPDTKIVMLTVAADEDAIFDALKLGAAGYLHKSMSGEAFLDLLGGLLRGEVVLSPEQAMRILQELSPRRGTAQVTPADSNPTTVEALTPRELEVLRLVARGLAYKQVAAALNITEATVKYHMGEILGRLQIENRRQAIAYARRIGIVDSG